MFRFLFVKWFVKSNVRMVLERLKQAKYDTIGSCGVIGKADYQRGVFDGMETILALLEDRNPQLEIFRLSMERNLARVK